MASNVAVDIVDVSKRFRLYQEKYQSIKERFIHIGRNPYKDFWAVRDVSLEVYEGETIGILGRNGSGKSTLLKCVSGILQPTSGKVVVRGQLAALLELGAGFQVELTGRENIYLNASLLGMSNRDIERRFDEIVAFAELEQFIDNQVKYYSSGMYVRLGFAVAVNVEPDILVVDEVLAVGDEKFQLKCIDKVKTFQDEGRTILLVSHSPDQVRALCDRAVVLESGIMVGVGTPGEAVRLFREHLLESGAQLTPTPVNEPAAPEPVASPPDPVASWPVDTGSTPAQLRSVRLGEVTTLYPGVEHHPYMVTGDPLTVRVEFEAVVATEGVSFSVELFDKLGSLLVGVDTELVERAFDLPGGRGALDVTFASVPFLDGAYDVTVTIKGHHGGVTYDRREGACRIEVMNPTRSIGVVSLPVRVSLETSVMGHEQFVREAR